MELSTSHVHTHFPHMVQAPSLLITLINMFLEFTRLPSDYVVEDRPAEENQYSVFGPTVSEAVTQVGGVTGRVGRGESHKLCVLCSGSSSEGSGDSSCGLGAGHAAGEAILSSLQAQAEVAGKVVGRCARCCAQLTFPSSRRKLVLLRPK